MNNWQPYPKNKPQEDDIKFVFVVLSPNPNIIKKSCYRSTAPKYCAVQAIWTGTEFVNNLWQPLVVDYYFQLPPFPTEQNNA